MINLYHHPLCPLSRKVRIHLAAKGINFTLINENFWQRRKEFIAINAAGTIPVLFDNSTAITVCGSSVIVEYIEEKNNDGKNFIGDSAEIKAESRRIQNWFDEKFYNEVSRLILHERYFKRYISGSHAPNSDTLRAARHNLNVHLNYIEYLLENKKYLAQDQISIADFAAAAQISVLDYFGDINWQHHAIVKDWYGLIKSHKIFSDILKDRIANINPPEWYSNLDF